MYHPLPEIQHTFRPDPQTPYVILSAIGTIAVVAPWVVLLGLVRAQFLFLSRVPGQLLRLSR
jgi:Oligosaccharyltransferase subunit Ribophorin II